VGSNISSISLSLIDGVTAIGLGGVAGPGGAADEPLSRDIYDQRITHSGC
jgi:hypothetical protein